MKHARCRHGALPRLYLTPVLLGRLHPHQPVLEQTGDNRRVHGALGVHLSNPRRDHVLRKFRYCVYVI